MVNFQTKETHVWVNQYLMNLTMEAGDHFQKPDFFVFSLKTP